MPSPWTFALRAIPWATLLANAPAIAKAAETLLARTRDQKRADGDVQGLGERVAALERHDRADAELLKQVTDQIQSLTAASEVIAARQRWIMLVAIASLALAILAGGLLIARG
jgi:hypothetical protein